ncbi:unnamed protein product [Dicrocoelium dendriticum]|nr:unnamed protein product [Dicrocoelium dendriticum]
MRTANERRIAAESALSAVRQRADVQAQRSSQLEREAATEKTRLNEKCQLQEVEMQKLRRRLLALQSEAAKWKKVYQAEKTAGDERVNRANQLLQSTLDERTRLEMDLKASLNREADSGRLIDQLRQQAAVDATDASSRLFVALSTGEEGVTTALELKRCIEEQLQPELQNTKQLYRESIAECEASTDGGRAINVLLDVNYARLSQFFFLVTLNSHRISILSTDVGRRGWREKHAKLNTELGECRKVVKELEDRLSELQATTDKELASLKLDLAKAERADQLKSALLAKSEMQVSFRLFVYNPTNPSLSLE